MTYWKLITQTLSYQTYPVERDIKDTTESNSSASNLNSLLLIGEDGQLGTSFNDTRDVINFHITNVSFLNSTIPSSPFFCVLSRMF